MNKRVGIIIMILSVLFTPVHLLAGSINDYLKVVASDSKGLILELWVPEPDIDEIWEGETLYHRITIPNFGATIDVGSPQLPLVGALLGVPRSGEPTIEVLETDSNILSGYNVWPAPKPVIIEGDVFRRLDSEFAMDKEVYSIDGFIPSSIAKIGFTGFMRDQRVVRVLLFPLQFNPATGELRYHSRIRVKVYFNTLTDEEGTISIKGKDSPYERLLKGVLLNYDEMR